MGASGSYPIAQPQFANAYAQGAQVGQGIIGGGSDLAELPQLLKGLQLQNALGEYKRQQAQAESKYYPEMALAKLQEAQAQPANTQAQTGLYTAESNNYNKMLPYNIKEKQAAIQQYLAQAKKTNTINDMINGTDSTNNSGSQNITSTATPSSQPSNMAQPSQQQTPVLEPAQQYTGNYGIETPTPSRDDKINKVAFGIDTYTPKLQQALELQKKQQQDYVDKISSVNKQVEEGQKYINQLDQFNYFEDQMKFQGKKRDWIPFSSWTSAAQSAQNLVNVMSLGAVENTKDAMGSGRFSNIDMNIAMGQKPATNWAPATRKFYSEFANGVQDRKTQMAKFYNVAGALKMAPQYADALWTQYQQKYPVAGISNKTGKPFVVKRNGDEWRQFLTPEAINSIATKGEYSPISQKQITKENIKDTMKATGLTKKQVLKKLEQKGYDISHIK